jgi:20S proteasome alpha/beta subunit
MTEAEGVELARKVLKKTAQRDNASGGVFTFKRVDATGVRTLGRENHAQR